MQVVDHRCISATSALGPPRFRRGADSGTVLAMIPKLLARLTIACAALFAALAPASAWEVIGGGPLPTFAATTPSVAPLSGASFSGGTPDAFAWPAFNPGYSANFGKALLGVETKTGFASNPFATAAGFESSQSSMKVGYDLGRFKPFVTAGFGEVRAPAFGGANLFSSALPNATNPFAPTSRSTTLGAGFNYAITEKLSVEMSVQATQVQSSGGWR
jgi:opacity protein-like surface antigen